MKRMLWIAAMLVVSLVSLAMYPNRATALQDPFPWPCGHRCTTDPGCVTECHNCKGDTTLEGGKTCQAF